MVDYKREQCSTETAAGQRRAETPELAAATCPCQGVHKMATKMREKNFLKR